MHNAVLDDVDCLEGLEGLEEVEGLEVLLWIGLCASPRRVVPSGNVTSIGSME